MKAATRSKANGKPRLLICDGHGSHMFANIVLLVLPPHSSHLTQPLSIFGPHKTHLTTALLGLISMEIARVQKFEWVDAYFVARERGGAGLIPFQPRKVIRQLRSAVSDTCRPVVIENQFGTIVPFGRPSVEQLTS